MAFQTMYCRTCFCVLQNNGQIIRYRHLMYNIFDNKHFTKKLILCSNTQIRPYDEYPHFVCQTCYEKVLNFYEFQLMCRDSLRMYNELLKSHTDLKRNLDNLEFLEEKAENNPYIENIKEKNYQQDIQPINESNEHILLQKLVNIGAYETNIDSAMPAQTKTISYDDDIAQLDTIENTMAVNTSNLLEETDKNLDAIIDNVFMQQDAILHEVDVYTTNENSRNIEDNLYGLLLQNETMIQKDLNIKDSDEKDLYENNYEIDNNTIANECLNQCDKEEPNIVDVLPNNNEQVKRVTREGLRSQSQEIRNGMINLPNKKEDYIISKKIKNFRYFCNICSKLFRFLHHLEAHKRKDHEGLPAYQCTKENCNETFDRFNDMKDHLLIHDGIAPPVLQCEYEGCDREFPRRVSLALHMSRAHNCLPKAQTHSCDVCGKVFKQLHKLREHSYIHKDKSTWLYTCDFEGCQRKCRTWIDMKQHKLRHMDTYLFKCPHCGVGKKTAHELKVHVNFHTLERTWRCEKCPKVCKTFDNLKRHIMNKHSDSKKQFKCSYCNAAFGTLAVKKNHEKKHSSDRPFVCDECGKGFIWAYRLKMHMNTHLDSKNKRKKSSI